MAETGGVASGGGQHDYSNLEVVPTHDYSNVGANKNDKIAFVPCRDHDKLVVPPQPYDAAHYDQGNHGPWSASTAIGWGDHVGGPGGDIATTKEERILGLKRRIFYIVLGIGLLLAAIGIGVGVGVGVSTRSRNDAGAEAAASSSSSQSATATSSTSQATPTLQSGGNGGRCTSGWGGDCTCLDENACAATWNGTSLTGHKPNWPCPNDPPSIKACYVHPCKGGSQPNSRCHWKEGCAERDQGK
jgi:hypothetical protein